MSRSHWTAVALAIVALMDGRPAPAANYTITIDGSRQTAGNPRFWAAAVGTGTASLTLRPDLQTHYKIVNRELGMQRVRGHGVLNDDMGIYKGAGSYDWTNFDKYLTAIVAAGMRPIMELDFMPTALALNGSSRDAPRDMNAWRQFVQAVVQHCIDKYGAADVGQWYWEVWNEPDYPGFWNGTNASEAAAAKMTDYYALYDATVAGATAAMPNILIGGPVTTNSGPIGAFLQHTKSAGIRVTFASSHAYGGPGPGTTANAASCGINDNNSRVSAITGAGYTTAQVQSFNTEWNSAYSGQGGNAVDNDVSMDSHVNAAFVLKAVKLISDHNTGDTAPLSVFSYWVASDVFDESGGPSGSYILGQGGNLPFGQVFGLMTFQGVRKAAFNGFKMLSYLGPRRLMSGGGTAADGVDGLATTSASQDELQILVYNYYVTINSSGTDNVTVTVNNLPAPLAGKELFVTHFRVDDSHSNPYGVWVNQGKPANPTEAQWQEMRQAQHLALLQPFAKATVTSTYTTTLTLPRQAASLIILGVNRPVIGRNAFVTMEGEDYDGQSGATKEASNDSDVGQSISVSAGGSIYFENVDFSDAGVNTVQLRVAAQNDTTLELHADMPTGTLLGTCAVTSTAGAWATQTCTVSQASGVHRVYVAFAGAARLNWLKFQGAPGGPGTGGMGGDGTTGGAGTGGTGISAGTGGTTGVGSGGGGGGTGSGGNGGSTPGASGGRGCGCGMGGAGRASGALMIVALFAAPLALRRRRTRRSR